MNLTNLRHQLDSLDQQIIKLLAKRQHLVVKIARLKQRHHLPIWQAQREKQSLVHKTQLATRLKLKPQFMAKIFSLILRESKQTQKEIIKPKNPRF